MQAVEFQANIKDGIVYIPQEYKQLHTIRNAKFFVMYDTVTNANTNTKKSEKKMKALSIDTIGFKFNRDEANAR